MEVLILSRLAVRLPAPLRAATLDLLFPLVTAHTNHILAAVAMACAGQCGGQAEAGQEINTLEGSGLVELVSWKMFCRLRAT